MLNTIFNKIDECDIGSILLLIASLVITILSYMIFFNHHEYLFLGIYIPIMILSFLISGIQKYEESHYTIYAILMSLLWPMCVVFIIICVILFAMYSVLKFIINFHKNISKIKFKKPKKELQQLKQPLPGAGAYRDAVEQCKECGRM